MNEKWEEQKRNCFTTCAVIMLAPATKAEYIMYIIHYHNTLSLPVILVFVAILVCCIAYLLQCFVKLLDYAGYTTFITLGTLSLVGHVYE
jgi:hypothetical protein